MKCFHDLKVDGVEEDRRGFEVVNLLEVGELGAADSLGVISLMEEEEVRWMGMLEITRILSEGLSFTDLHLLGCVIEQWARFTFTNSMWKYQLN